MMLAGLLPFSLARSLLPVLLSLLLALALLRSLGAMLSVSVVI
jgi:hypothetical protein